MRALILAVLLLGGCPAAHSDYPDKTCKAQADCFKGEMCMLGADNNGVCIPADSGDGGTP